MAKRSLADVVRELDSCNSQLKTNQSDDTVGQKYKLLDERANLLHDALTPLRTAVLGLFEVKPTMTATKAWGSDFNQLPPSNQLKQYEEACRIARELAAILLIELPETEQP
jgi:hypothetical protein